MPLDSPKEAMIRFIKRFCEPVGRNSHRLQSAGNRFDRLVMTAVHGQCVDAEAAIQRGIFCNHYVMDRLIIGTLLMMLCL